MDKQTAPASWLLKPCLPKRENPSGTLEVVSESCRRTFMNALLCGGPVMIPESENLPVKSDFHWNWVQSRLPRPGPFNSRIWDIELFQDMSISTEEPWNPGITVEKGDTVQFSPRRPYLTIFI